MRGKPPRLAWYLGFSRFPIQKPCQIYIPHPSLRTQCDDNDIDEFSVAPLELSMTFKGWVLESSMPSDQLNKNIRIMTRIIHEHFLT